MSRLSHPHICSLFDIGYDQQRLFLIFEFLEGETLAARIAKGPIAVKESLTVALEIASALEYAHSKGIIHRDLKPGNIMLTPGGAKLLDFGLAKPQAAHSILSGQPAQDGTARIETQEGRIFGTIAYMSPEQAEGKTQDARTDVFSFGTVLYEMFSGRRPFTGDSPAAVLGAILRGEPPRLGNELIRIPGLEALILKCLRKSPAGRPQSFAGIRAELQVIADRYPGSLRWTQSRMAAIGVAVILLVAAIIYAIRQPNAASSGGEPRFVQLTFDPGSTKTPSISADGKYVTYASDKNGPFNIYVQAISNGSAVQLTHSAYDLSDPVFSLDGKDVFYHSTEDEGLYSVPATGGTPRFLIHDGYLPRVSPDGKMIAFLRGPWVGAHRAYRELYVMKTDGTESRLVSQDIFLVGEDFAWSTDGKKILVFTVGRDLGRRDNIYYWLSLDGSSPAPAMLPIEVLDRVQTILGPWLYVTRQAKTTWEIVRIPAGESFGGQARAEPVANSTDRIASLAGINSGLFAVANSRREMNLYAASVDPKRMRLTGLKRLTYDSRVARNGSLSNDGHTLAYLRSGDAAPDLVIRDMKFGQERVIDEGHLPSLSPDGRWVAYSNRFQELFVIRTFDDSKKPLSHRGVPSHWSPDSRILYFWVIPGSPGAQWELFKLDTTNGNISKDERFNSGFVIRISPNEHLYACALPGYPRVENVFLVPVGRPCGEGPGATRIAQNSDRLESLTFSQAGDALYWVTRRQGRAQINGLQVDPISGEPRRNAAVVTEFQGRPELAVSGSQRFDMRRNQFILTLEEDRGNVWMIKIPPTRN